MAYIAIVDDEEDLREIIELHLKKSGFKIKSFSNGKDFLHSLANEKPDAVILDIMMDGLNGYEVLAEIKRKSADIGVLFLSAKNQTFDKVLGLDLGADDYLTKPFQKEELVARIKSILRRREKKTDKRSGELTVYTNGNFCFNVQDKTLVIDGASIDITKTEYLLLKLLVSYPGKVFEREAILNYVWDDAVVNERTIDVHIKRLRKKLGASQDMIKTHPGLGYSIARIKD